MRYALLAVFAAAPLAALAADNGGLIGVPDVAPYYCGLLFASALVTATAEWRRGRAAAERTAVCASVAILIAFDYWDIRPLLSALTHDARPSMVFLWAVLLGAALALAWRLAQRFSRLPLAMLIGGTILLLPSLVSWARTHDVRQRPLAGGAPLQLELARRPAPNVYVFLLDAYSRADRLRQQFGLDDSGFLNALRRRGFVVPARSQTGYGVTGLSVPTILNMRYALARGVAEPGSVAAALAGRNATVRAFRSLGYTYALAPSELGDWKCDGSEDACVHATQTYASHLGVSQLAWAVMERTPTADLLRSFAPVHVNPLSARRQFPLRVAHAVAGLGLHPPVLTFAHVLLPHWPYLYLGRRCRVAGTRGRLGAKAYVQAIRCTNANTEAAVRYVVRRDPHAVIVLASDHGSDADVPADVPQADWPSDAVDRRFSNFVALRLPHACRHDVPGDLAAVNIMRIVLGCIAKPRLPMLPGRRYLSGPQINVQLDRTAPVRRRRRGASARSARRPTRSGVHRAGAS